MARSAARTTKSKPAKKDLPIIIAGGGIGGLAVALTLAKTGHSVHVVEQAKEFSEIGAGIQLGPNAGKVLGKWGVTEHLKDDLVAPTELRMMDGISGSLVGLIPLGGTFSGRFGSPYYVAHRGDLHRALHKACKGEKNIKLQTSKPVERYKQDEAGVTVHLESGKPIKGKALIGADGLRSKVREQMLRDGAPDYANHTCYRTLLTPEQMPEDVRWNAATLWAGPQTHLVHYPISGGKQYNIVATVCSDWRQEGWNAPASTDELQQYFKKGCDRVQRIIKASSDYRKWALADRKPVTTWTDGRVVLLGDAAHPVLQYYAQGAAMALEDADCLAEMLVQTKGEIVPAFAKYAAARQPRTAKLYRESRKLGEIYHASGIKRFVRNIVMRRTRPDTWYE
ncbi:MAG: FAD-dependent monooxygenase, partial [Fimbriimonadaceae bacterium]|nr:FAD-dependent monooxygenase [Alphaproteobacteria bacterium]